MRAHQNRVVSACIQYKHQATAIFQLKKLLSRILLKAKNEESRGSTGAKTYNKCWSLYCVGTALWQGKKKFLADTRVGTKKIQKFYSFTLHTF